MFFLSAYPPERIICKKKHISEQIDRWIRGTVGIDFAKRTDVLYEVLAPLPQSPTSQK
jgi:hypothetical protein